MTARGIIIIIDVHSVRYIAFSNIPCKIIFHNKHFMLRNDNTITQSQHQHKMYSTREIIFIIYATHYSLHSVYIHKI